MNLLRDYQLDCLNTVNNHFKTHDKQLIVLPTGSGKTFIFLTLISSKNYRSLIICPTIDLQNQILLEFKKFGLNSVSTNIDTDASHFIFVAASLNKDRTKEFLYRRKFDIIVIDEAHRANCKTYIQFLDNYPYPHKLLGCTATPERLDKKPLTQVFTHFTYKISLLELIKNKYLVDLSCFRIRTKIKISNRKSDFTSTELKMLDSDTRNDVIKKTFLQNCTQKKTLIFCLNIEHADKISLLLREHGIKCASIHGNKSLQERKDIIEGFRKGKYTCLTNCQLLTEGFDEPSIEALIIARPTCSKALYTQMIGRGLRTYPGKTECVLYELTDNNHSITTFEDLSEITIQKKFENLDGLKLSDLDDACRVQRSKELISAQSAEIEIEKIKYSLVDSEGKHLWNSFLQKPASITQKRYLEEIGVKTNAETNLLEYLFYNWKDKLKKKYG